MASTAPIAPLPVPVFREDGEGQVVRAFNLPRSLADDGSPHQNSGLANGREFCTAPLMGIGRIGPPFLHDGRVYLSNLSVASTPASTVHSNAGLTNGPLFVQTLDDALMAIELHDLPAPDGKQPEKHGIGGSCPLHRQVSRHMGRLFPGLTEAMPVKSSRATDLCQLPTRRPSWSF
jgi:hypothetical protein